MHVLRRRRRDAARDICLQRHLVEADRHEGVDERLRLRPDAAVWYEERRAGAERVRVLRWGRRAAARGVQRSGHSLGGGGGGGLGAAGQARGQAARRPTQSTLREGHFPMGNLARAYTGARLLSR